MDATADDKGAIARAAAIGDELKGVLNANDAEGLAAKESNASFAASLAELDALMEDSDDEPMASQHEVEPDASELATRHLQRLEQESAWQSGNVGLELQKPFSTLLLSGAKTVETRSYPLPAALIGQRISILETQEGAACISALADEVMAGDSAVRLIGTVTFSSCFAYASVAEFAADEARHLVPRDSPYMWSKDRIVFAWVVGSADLYEQPAATPALRRRMRSLFEMCA